MPPCPRGRSPNRSALVGGREDGGRSRAISRISEISRVASSEVQPAKISTASNKTASNEESLKFFMVGSGHLSRKTRTTARKIAGILSVDIG